MKNSCLPSMSSAHQRRTLFKGAFLFGTKCLGFWHTSSSADSDDFLAILSQLQTNPNFSEQMQNHSEREIGSREGLERAPIRVRKSLTPISSRARELIIACEITSKKVYNARYRSPVWPRGQSGVTIGIGYDIGYVSPIRLKADWAPYIGNFSVSLLSDACGHMGTAAATFIEKLQPVKIGWEAAIAQFDHEVSPRYVAETEIALPNTSDLNDDMLGALVSLTYNRGASYTLAKKRYEQMRAIKSHMINKRFEKIPAEIRGMKWIWQDDPDMKGVLLRRDAEAALFEHGLQSR